MNSNALYQSLSKQAECVAILDQINDIHPRMYNTDSLHRMWTGSHKIWIVKNLTWDYEIQWEHLGDTLNDAIKYLRGELKYHRKHA